MAKQMFDRIYQAEQEADQLIEQGNKKVLRMEETIKAELHAQKDENQKMLYEFKESYEAQESVERSESEQEVEKRVAMERAELLEKFHSNRDTIANYIVQVVLANYGGS